MKKTLLIVVAFHLVAGAAYSQFDAFLHQLEIQDSLSTYNGREKLFVHYDRPQYNLNDTIWLKGYIVAGPEQRANDSSRIAYLEFIDANGELVKRISASCKMGLFFSNLTLSERLFSQGIYTLRAYTNHMRGFGDSLFYLSSFKIIDPKAKAWQVALREFNLSGNQFYITAGLRKTDQAPLSNSRVQVTLRSGNKVMLRQKMVTDDNGNIYIDTLLKNNKYNKALRLEIDNENLQVQLPLPTDNKNIDVQFLPEGGTLIAGKKQRIGVKAIDIYGKGVDVQGVVKDTRGNIATNFSTLHKGMGIMKLTPVKDEADSALLENGTSFTLPVVQSSGTLLQVRFNEAADSILLSIDVGVQQKQASFFITGSVRGLYYLKARMHNHDHYELKLPTNGFPDGVAHFVLYNDEGIPLNERAAFIWHNRVLQMEMETSKAAYLNKDSVMLALSVKDKNRDAVFGSFSMAVIDTSLVEMNLDAENIVSYMMLTSDLKGTVEEPFFYIKNPYTEATDALMLTQGWVGYNFAGNEKGFPYEKEYAISGKVTNLLNKPSVQTRVMLLTRVANSGMLIKDTITNSDGYFLFNNFPVFFTDSVGTVVRAVNKKEKSFGTGIEVFEKDYPEITDLPVQYDPKYFLFDTTIQQRVKRNTQVMEQARRDANYLEDVVVVGVARVPGSKNLNEDGGADQKILKEQLDRIPKETLLQVLVKRFPQFPRSRTLPFKLGNSPIYLVFDGMDLAFYDINPFDILEYYLAEDIKGIEIMTSPRYLMPYQLKFGQQFAVLNTPVFIEITTYGSVGPFLRKKSGMYLLKPGVPFVGKHFYTPRYSSPNQTLAFPDLRQTIYWNADIVTDNEGKATVSFFTSESKGAGYLVILQGTDFKGGFGTLIAPLRLTK